MGQLLTTEFDFPSAGFAGLPIKDQVRKCRAMAVEAKELATTASNHKTRDGYLDLAQQWLALADEMQRVC